MSETVPLVSVVIPAYNRGVEIAGTLDSALAQSYPRKEVIVVDDGSTDETISVLDRYRERITLIRQKNQGGAIARNTGIMASKGEYIALLDHDDLWHADKLSIQVSMSERSPDCGLIVSDGSHIDRQGQDGAPLLGPRLREAIISKRHGSIRVNAYRLLLSANVILCPSQTLIPRSVLEKVGLLTTARDEPSDYELYLRIALRYPFLFHTDSLVKKRYLPQSRSGPIAKRPILYPLLDIAMFRRHMPLCPKEHLSALQDAITRRVEFLCRELVDSSANLEHSYRRQAITTLRELIPGDQGVANAYKTLMQGESTPKRDRGGYAARIRRLIIEQSRRANLGHIGSALSIADIVGYIYENEIHAISPEDDTRDCVVLSKGHASLALYAALYLKGWLTREQFESYGANGTLLAVHPDHRVPGVDFSTGSLGQGLSFAAGVALASKLKNTKTRVFAILSDAECNEGSTWEAAMFCSHHGLSNLVAILDFNGQQAFGYTEDVICLEPIVDKWKSFGWNVVDLDGHAEQEIGAAFGELNTMLGRPHLIVARTTLGQGVSFMEGRLDWHYLPLSEEQYLQALSELESEP